MERLYNQVEPALFHDLFKKVIVGNSGSKHHAWRYALPRYLTNERSPVASGKVTIQQHQSRVRFCRSKQAALEIGMYGSVPVVIARKTRDRGPIFGIAHKHQHLRPRGMTRISGVLPMGLFLN